MIEPFSHEALPMRVVFGSGTIADLVGEVERFGAGRALVLGTPGRGAGLAQAVADSLGQHATGVHAGAVMHTPTHVTERALQIVDECCADVLVAVGGGSTLGLAKAIALRTGLPWIALPTTYAGSEMTPILGETAAGVKTTRRTPAVLPDSVVYDVDLTVDLPVAFSGASGLNAIAHGMEALYAPDANPLVTGVAEQGIAALARALPAIAKQPHDVDARSHALCGAWLCGVSLGAVSMGLHHKLCHVLGGAFDLPHAQTHAVVLPHVAAYNCDAAPGAMTALARALGTNGAARQLHALGAALGIESRLRDLGMPADGIETATDRVLESNCANPRPLERAAIRDLIARAWQGDSPRP